MRVRFRIDGVLHDVTTVPRRMAPGVVSRVKIMAELDISERRLPQDGRVGLTVDGRHVDLRVVTLPTVHGESIVMRILDKEAVVMELDKLGMGGDERDRFERAFHQSHGAVLVTGPTGSGKSTTLYAALQELNTPEKNIITIEDPVEYQVEGITQIQVTPKAGLTFAAGLRAIVRADPDVIMVGEIRDRETAQIAIESALTGHLVLSTLHTNDAPSAITRLVEMGIEPFLVASALDCVVAQRLVRMLCPHCKQRAIISAEVLRENGYKALVDLEAYEPVGCRRCGGSGYRGRTGIYEVMSVTPEIRALALERRSAEEIREMAMRQGMRRLRDDGLDKVRQGRTSIAEIARVLGSRLAGFLAPGAATRIFVHVAHAQPHNGRTGVDGRAMDIDFADLLMEVVSRRASDLHLTAGAHPTVRVRGRLTPLEEYPVLSPPTRARSSTRSSPATSASAWRPTGSSTSPTRSPATPASASTPTSSAARSAPPSA